MDSDAHGRSPRAGTLCGAGAAVWLALCLGAGPQGAVAQIQPASSAVATPSLATLRALGERGRRDPEGVLTELARWRARLPVGSEAWREHLLVTGMLLGDLRRADALDALLRELDAGAPEDARVRAAGLLVRGNLEHEQGDLARAEDVLLSAQEIEPSGPNDYTRLRIAELLTTVYIDRGARESAVSMAQDAVRIVDALAATMPETDTQRLRARTLNNLARALLRADDAPRAREYNVQAQRAAELSGDLVEASRSRNVEAYILSELGQPGERESLVEALRLADAAGWQRQRMIVLGNLADSHLTAGEYELAIRRSNETLVLARAAGVEKTESLALTNLGLAEIGLGRIEPGSGHVEAALAIERRRNAHAEEAQILKELGRALERAGATAAAVDAFHRYRDLQDRMLVRVHQRSVLDLQARYDREQRDRELALRAREAQLQEASLRSDALRRQVWFLAIVAGGLALGVVALLLQQQRRANRAMADVNERLRAEGELDVLTGLANRRHVQDRVGRPTAFRGALFLIDLDHFKRINDRHGHAGGDRVLIAVADRLRVVLRESDLVARWGGEEFLVVTPALSVQRAEELAQRLLADIAGQAVDLGSGMSVRPSVSIGYASFPLVGAPPEIGWERALALVDRALYRAKARGRNRACGVLRWPGAEAAEATDSLFERDGEALAWSEGPPLPRATGSAGAWPEAAAS